MTESERAAARAALEQGERIARVILGAAAVASSVARGVESALRTTTRAKSMS